MAWQFFTPQGEVKTKKEVEVVTAVEQKWETGDVKWSGNDDPAPGWIKAEGQEVSRTGEYADLFTKWGTKFGAGNGSTTFNVLDARDTFAIGASATKPVGDTGGEAEVTLDESEMPQHNHSGTATSSGSAHTHDSGTLSGRVSASNATNNNRAARGDGGGAADSQVISGNTGTSGSAHTHGLSIDDAGGNQAHNNMPPWVALNCFIKL